MQGPKNLSELLIKSIIVRNASRDAAFKQLKERYQELENKCADNLCSGCKKFCRNASSDFHLCKFNDCYNQYCSDCSENDKHIILNSKRNYMNGKCLGVCHVCITRCWVCGSAEAQTVGCCSLRVCQDHIIDGPYDIIACSIKCSNNMQKTKEASI